MRAYLLGLSLLTLAGWASETVSEPMPMAHRAPVLGLALAGDACVAVGARGHILRSTDMGRNWEQVTSPTRETLTAVTFPDEQRGWVAGHYGTLLFTGDGGSSWQLHKTAQENEDSFLTLLFISAERGIAAGAYGLFLHTENGGASWQQSFPLPNEVHFNQLRQGREGRLYAVLETGLLALSGDEGHSWEELDSPYGGSLFGVLPLSDGQVLIHGLRGNAFLGIPEEGDWQQLEIPARNALLMDSVRLNDGRVVISGSGDTYFIGDPKTGSLQAWEQGVVHGTAALLALPDGALLAGGLNGVHRLEPPSAR